MAASVLRMSVSIARSDSVHQVGYNPTRCTERDRTHQRPDVTAVDTSRGLPAFATDAVPPLATTRLPPASDSACVGLRRPGLAYVHVLHLIDGRQAVEHTVPQIVYVLRRDI